MKVTSMEEFREELLATGSYETKSANRRAERRRSGFFTTLGFTATAFSVFPKCAIAEACGRLTTDRWAHFCWRAAQSVERLGASVKMCGWKNREQVKGPVMYLSNHMSTLETVLLPPVLLSYGPFNVVVKASLSHLPFLEKAAAHMGLIPLTRTSPREDLRTMMTVGLKRIGEGNSILIFPQGTRRREFDPVHFSSIGAKLAEKAGIPIIPVAVKTDIQPTRDGGGVFKDFGTVDPEKDVFIDCGEPIPVSDSKTMHRATIEWIAGRLRSWGLPVKGGSE